MMSGGAFTGRTQEQEARSRNVEYKSH